MTYCREIADRIWDIFTEYTPMYTTIVDGMKISFTFDDGKKYDILVKRSGSWDGQENISKATATE